MKHYRRIVAIFAGVLTSLGVVTPTLATPPDSQPDLIGKFTPMEIMICADQKKEINFYLDLENIGFYDISILSTKGIRTETEQVVNPDNGLLNDVAVKVDSKLKLNFKKDKTDGVKSKSKSKVEVTLPIHDKDGYYRELIQFRYEKKLYGAKGYREFTLNYVVEGNCIELVTDEEYDFATQKISTYYTNENGVLEIHHDPGGTASFEPYNGEPLDVAVVEELAEDRFANYFHDDAYLANLEQEGSLDNTSAYIVNREDGFQPAMALLAAPVAGSRNPQNPIVTGDAPAAPAPLYLRLCIRMRYTDMWHIPPEEDWDFDTTGMKWWQPIGDQSKRNMIGTRFEIWDYDPSGGDDFIASGYLYYSAEGNYSCVDFTWDQSQAGEDYPDPYIKTDFQVRDVEFLDQNSKIGYFRTSCSYSASKYWHTWRTSYIANLGESSSTAHKDYQFEETDSDNKLAMYSAGLQKFFRTWQSWYMTSSIYVDYDPSSQGTSSSGPDCINFGGSGDNYKQWMIPAHEAGHSYQDQLLGYNQTGACPNPHIGYCSYHDQCAASEGWASFVAMRTWYPDSKDSSSPVLLTAENIYPIEPGGFEFVTGDPQNSECGTDYRCSTLDTECYSKNEMMATRAFWDIWDNNVDGVDDANTTTDWHYLPRIWYNFPAGTCNEGCEEEYDKNMRDYHHNSSSISSDLYDDIWRVYDDNLTAMERQSWP